MSSIPHGPEGMERRSDIAFYGFRGGPGGISKVMLNLINETSMAGFHVDVLLHSDTPETRDLDPKTRIIRLGRAPAMGRFLPLARYLASNGPQVLLSNREWANRNAVLARMASRAGTKLVFRVGNPPSYGIKKRGALKGWLRRLSIKATYQRAGLVIANSGKIAEEVRDMTGVDPARIIRIPNPTVAEDVLERSSRPVSHRWFHDKGPPVVLAVGRLAKQKDFSTLLAAMGILRMEYGLEARLIILGEGNERKKLGDMARSLGLEGAIDMPGFVPEPFPYMARASIFVLSSAWEGSPNVLIEALAIGVPVVSTDCPSGPREILQGGKYGRLVPVGDSEALARAMFETIKAPHPPEYLREAAEPFRSAACARKYLEAMGMA